MRVASTAIESLPSVPSGASASPTSIFPLRVSFQATGDSVHATHSPAIATTARNAPAMCAEPRRAVPR